MIYAVIAYMLPNIVTGIGSAFFSYADIEPIEISGQYLSAYNIFTLSNSVLGVSSAMGFVTAVVMIVFGIVLLSGKKWGAVAMGVAMSVATLVSAVPVSVLIGISFAFFAYCLIYGLFFGVLSVGLVITIVFAYLFLILAAYLLAIFVALTAIVCGIFLTSFIGWLFYSFSAMLSCRADRVGKTSAFGIVLKIFAAPLVALGGLSQITLPAIIFAALAVFGIFGEALPALGTIISILFVVLLVLGGIILISLVSIPMLAIGMIISVKCKPDKQSEIDEQAEASEEETIIAE